MKTTVKVIQDTDQCHHKKGDVGYIDGYVQAADSRPYAVVVSKEGVIDLVPVYALKKTGFITEGDLQVL